MEGLQKKSLEVTFMKGHAHGKKINLSVTGEIMGSDLTTTTWEYNFGIIIVFHLHK